MQKWFTVTPELVEVGESVRKWDYDLNFYVELEVLKICPKTFLVLKYDKKKEKDRSVYIRYEKLGIVPREVNYAPDTPEVLQNISVIWDKLAEQSKDEGYFTVRAGFYFVYHSKLWFLYAPGYTEGHYMPYVDTIYQHLIDVGATHVEFDEGELN